VIRRKQRSDALFVVYQKPLLVSQTKHKKSFKIPKGYSEAINRRTDNTMTERKKNKRANSDLQYTTGARGTELPPPFLTFCLHIYFQ